MTGLLKYIVWRRPYGVPDIVCETKTDRDTNESDAAVEFPHGCSPGPTTFVGCRVMLVVDGDLLPEMLKSAVCAQTIAVVPAVCRAWRAVWQNVLAEFPVLRHRGRVLPHVFVGHDEASICACVGPGHACSNASPHARWLPGHAPCLRSGW